MSAVKTIYKTPVDVKCYSCDYDDKQLMHTQVTINYDGQTFFGFAETSPEDKDFYSIKVGKNIATSRARIEALKYARDKAISVYNIKKQFWKEINSTYAIYDDDSWSEMTAFIADRNIRQAKYNVDRIRKAIKAEEKDLYLYLKDLDRVITSVKRQRAMAAADNEAKAD